VDEDMVDEPILDFQGKPIEPGIVSVPFASVGIVGGEHKAFSQQFVKKQKRGAIKNQEFGVPEDMKNLGFGGRGIAESSTIVAQGSEGFVR
jgi:hypothetical protein